MIILPLQNPTTFNGALILKANVGPSWTFSPYVVHHYYSNENVNFYDRTVQRSQFIEEYIYTKSKCRIVATHVNNLGANGIIKNIAC